MDLLKIRNIGISAHIDSGKTTLTERILFYSNKIHKMHEVKDKDGKGATMDSMELEKERGITISSAATNVEWDGYSINIIDTPGHVDFTIEVERALRVLDGAVLVLCAVGGVQSQSITVDRQLKRYRVPRIAFINKCDRIGANPYRVTGELREKLGLNPILTQIPIGLEKKHEGVIDLIAMKAIYFKGENGEALVEGEIPEELRGEAESVREEMIDTISIFSDEVSAAFVEDKLTSELLERTIREAAISLKVTPVFLGSAYKNKGVQPLIDGIIKYLPAPDEVSYTAHDLKQDEGEVELVSDTSKPAVALAFKLEDGKYGRLSYVRVYQGKIAKGDYLYNSHSRKKIRIGRIIRMHSDKMEDIDTAYCGDIIAFFGVDCRSGDTFTQPGLEYSMTSMHVPKPVISLSIKANNGSSERMMKALQRFIQEDPTFTTHVDEESGERIISGMGELHLDIYVERMRREYNAIVEVGKPQVAYRETISKETAFDYTHRKQSGGAGQYARVIGAFIPDHESDYEFVNNIKGGVIPGDYIPACDRGFKECMKKGALLGFPVIGVKAVLNDGDFHAVDSSTMAFQAAARSAFRQAYRAAIPQLLEPVMKVTIEGPAEFQGNVFTSVNERRGIIISTTENDYVCRVESEVPLAEMFGFATVLRSLTEGKSEFSMELSKYSRVPDNIVDKIKKEIEEKKRQAHK